MDAILEDALFHPRDLRQDTRWPEYSARVAAELDWTSMLSYRLSPELTGPEVLAGLNIYAKQPRAFDPTAVEMGLLLATHASATVAAQTNRQRAEHLDKALQSSRQIGIAVGILMGRHKLTRTQAFDLMRVASQNSNRKVRDIAEEVEETGTLPYPRSGR